MSSPAGPEPQGPSDRPASDDNPYTAPAEGGVVGRAASGRPWVVGVFRACCAAMCLVWLLVSVVLLLGELSPGRGLAAPSGEVLAPVVILLLASLAYGVGVFFPREPWAWLNGLALLLLALPASVPLLLFWFRADVLQYFGRSPGLARPGARSAPDALPEE